MFEKANELLRKRNGNKKQKKQKYNLSNDLASKFQVPEWKQAQISTKLSNNN